MDNSATHDRSKKNGTRLSEERFEVLVKKYEKILIGIIFAKIGDWHKAQDISQDTFILAWRNLGQLADERKFIGWVRKIAFNEINDRIVKFKRREKHSENVIHLQLSEMPKKSHLDDPSIALIDGEMDQLVGEKHIFRLPDELRKIYVARNVSGASFKDIGHFLGIDEETAIIRYLDAKERLTPQAEKVANGFLVLGSPFMSVTDSVMARIAQLEATTVSTAGTIASANLSFPLIFAAIGYPFFWAFALLIGGQRCGIEFILKAPTIQAKRWLTKKLLAFHYGLASMPLLILAVGYFYAFGMDSGHQIAATIFAGYVIAAGLYLLRTRMLYHRVLAAPEQNDIGYDQLKRSVHRGFLLTAVLFLSFFCGFACIVMVPVFKYRFETNDNAYIPALWLVVLVVFLLVVVVQIIIVYLFRYLLEVCATKNYSITAPLPLDTLTGNWKASLLREFIYALPFNIYFSGCNILHLLLIQKRFYQPIFEIGVYSLLWGFVICENMGNKEGRWRRLWGMAAIQFIIFHCLRKFIYD